MRDPYNPTADDLKAVASDPEWNWPPSDAQDWDLMVATQVHFGPLLVEFVEGRGCVPQKRGFFLHCLYLMVGNHARSLKAKAELKKRRRPASAIDRERMLKDAKYNVEVNLRGDMGQEEFRTRKGALDKEHRQLLEVLEKAEKTPEPALCEWLKRSRAVLKRPQTFHYDEWCLGGLSGRYPPKL